MSTIDFSHQVPILPVHNMTLTLEYYQDQLGFEKIWKWDDPPTIASVTRDDLTMLFSFDPDKTFLASGMDIMIFLKGVKDLYEIYKAKNLKFADDLEEKPWGVLEFSILDINGYYLRFAENI